MKEFEEWWGNSGCHVWDLRGCKAAYRAALEEVLKQLNDIYNGDFENSDIVKWIKNELGDT